MSVLHDLLLVVRISLGPSRRGVNRKNGANASRFQYLWEEERYQQKNRGQILLEL